MATLNHSRERGVTLIELMVTLVILAMLALGVGPSITAWRKNTQVRNTASSLMAGLTRARNEAMRRNTQVRFSLVSLTNSSLMDSSCALSDTGVSWVVSIKDPVSHCDYAPVTLTDDAAYAAAVADANNPFIVESQAGGQGGNASTVAGKTADGSATANTVTFNGFGRIVDTAPIGIVNIDQATAGDYRKLRVELNNSGGTIRMCDRDMAVTTDPRYCQTRAIP